MLTFVDRKVSRRIVKITVSEQGKDALTKVANAYGMKEYVVGGRIYDWFMRQDDIFQRAVLGLLKGLEVDAARVFMERIAAERKNAGDDREIRGAPSIYAPEPEQPAHPKPEKEPGTGPESAGGRKGRGRSK